MNPQTEEKQYWRSIEELNATPEFKEWLHREFQDGATEVPQGTSRRNMLAVMGATFGLMGLTACRRPEQSILPNAIGVEDYLPGEPLYYSTAMPLSGVSQGLVVRVNDGRPTKIEGNPEHPFSLGGATGYQQASVLSVYDPDRSKAVLKGGADSTWEDFFEFATKQVSAAGQGEGLRFLSERTSSPSLQALRDSILKKYPQAKWVEYEPASPDSADAAAQLAFGQSVAPLYHYDKADVILSLDSDFLGLDSPTVQSQKLFSKKRRIESPKDEMNRLYVVEGQFSVTGGMADHRLRMRSADVRDFAVKLANQLNAFGSALKVLQEPQGRAEKFLTAVAKDLQNAKGRSLVVAGPRQPAEVQALAFLLNQTLGNNGQTVTYVKPASTPAQSQLAGLKALNGEMAAGTVKTLFILGSNPVYTAPADLKFGDNLKKVPVSIHLGHEVDETGAASTWHLPEAHYLEAWSDSRSPDGTATIQQPMIQPLYGGKTCAEVLAGVVGNPETRGYDIVRKYWTSAWPKDKAEKTWRASVHSGVIADTAYPAANVTADAKKISAALTALPAPAPGIELVFVPSHNVYDGRFANNAWLQEAPDPITKLVWDNAALISPGTARSLGIDPLKETKGVVLSIERNGQRITIPSYVQPGMADQVVILPLGYGRLKVGRVGSNHGTDVYPLRTSDAHNIALGANVKNSGEGPVVLAITQDHHSMEGRPLVREASLEEYAKEPNVIEEQAETPALFSLFDEHSYAKGQQWGMAIDVNSCVGCNACIIACQAENNIPTVGKDQVLRGREMHWIRMDRYYIGELDEPKAVMAAVPCMQCENAPCEAVCPVAATVHSPEGLNDMAYNRCVGTRYCSNNCPYKVRRFNFFNWHKNVEESQKMVFNPDATVRMRGVMEKCNYCVQRIERGKITARTAFRYGQRDTELVKDGEVTPACAQTCPTDSIVFGDINDPNSRVAKLKKQKRNYGMLEELNTRPRTTYLAKLRNTNPELSA